jgi:hypothetical protein
MRDDDIFPPWAYAFAGLVIYLVGVAVCYVIPAFAFLTIDPTEFGPVGRGLFIVLGLAWTVLFIHAANDNGPEEE